MLGLMHIIEDSPVPEPEPEPLVARRKRNRPGSAAIEVVADDSDDDVKPDAAKRLKALEEEVRRLRKQAGQSEKGKTRETAVDLTLDD
ncbi:hypothetical protein IAT38_000953 [Cryptococcus sp. DSM 104549]